MNNPIYLALTSTLCLMLAHAPTSTASDHSPKTSHDSHADKGAHQHGAASLELSAQQLKRFGVEVSTARPGQLQQSVTLPGEVQLNREALAHITPRYAAKITSVKAKTGDRVEAGDVLAVAESSETLARFELKSLISGTVINSHLALGEHLQSSDTAFVVADLSTLWVDIALYPEQVPQVHEGQSVTISTRYGPEPIHTQVGYVAPLIDERSRTGLARVFLNNEQRQWKPGQFIDARIVLKQLPVEQLVPRSAVIEWQGQDTVFVQDGQHWTMRHVTTGRSDEQSVEILDGLNTGERYIAKGGFVLKADQLKSDFSDGHNH